MFTIHTFRCTNPLIALASFVDIGKPTPIETSPSFSVRFDRLESKADEVLNTTQESKARHNRPPPVINPVQSPAHTNTSHQSCTTTSHHHYLVLYHHLLVPYHLKRMTSSAYSLGTRVGLQITIRCLEPKSLQLTYQALHTHHLLLIPAGGLNIRQLVVGQCPGPQTPWQLVDNLPCN